MVLSASKYDKFEVLKICLHARRFHRKTLSGELRPLRIDLHRPTFDLSNSLYHLTLSTIRNINFETIDLIYDMHLVYNSIVSIVSRTFAYTQMPNCSFHPFQDEGLELGNFALGMMLSVEVPLHLHPIVREHICI